MSKLLLAELERFRVEMGASNYLHDLRTISDYLAGLPELSKDQVIDFHNWLLHSKGYAKGTIVRKMVVFRRFLDWLTVENCLTAALRSEMETVFRAKVEKRRSSYQGRHIDLNSIKELRAHFKEAPAIPPEGDHEALVDSLTYARNRAFIEVGYTSGGRLSEVLGLNRTDFDGFLRSWDEKSPLIIQVRRKGNKQGQLILWPPALRAIHDYLELRGFDGREALFVGHSNSAGQRLDPSTMQKIVKALASSLGLKGFVAPHALRHAFVMELLAEDVPLELISQALGHANLGTTLNVYGGQAGNKRLLSQIGKVMDDE